MCVLVMKHCHLMSIGCGFPQRNPIRLKENSFNISIGIYYLSLLFYYTYTHSFITSSILSISFAKAMDD